ncbi:MAG: hypothetical protein DI598_14970 [Pseudopedobacter saltans]|uniref:Uncharacterized protein n=1 Tax=Pseudopedobacter saltans TaxID=151895 RepID=A0A2W5EIC2_9SPHI|nr:MAG: hypothetical protein DI598_14970 [Pseudopedobacter saltans]
MASLFSWLDGALTDVANYTGSDKNELLGGIIQSAVKTAETGKATVVTNAGTAVINKVTPTLTNQGLGLNVTTDVGLQKKTLWYICGAIVAAVLLAVFLPKLFVKKKKYSYAR